MQSIVIDWDGVHLPSDLQKLPPGRYIVELVDDVAPLTPQEEDGLIAALDNLDAGQAVPFTDVVRNIRRG